MKNAIIFDFDGVLVDSRQRYYAAVAEVVNRYMHSAIKHDVSTVEAAKAANGWNDDLHCMRGMLRTYRCTGAPDDVLLDAYLEVADSQRAKASEVSLVGERTLRHIAEMYDVRLGVFTSRPRRDLYDSLARFGLGGCIAHELVVTLDECADCPKPSGVGLARLVRSQQTLDNGRWKYWRCVYLGDNVDDARAAQGAGVPFIGVHTTADGRQRLRDAYSVRGLPCVADVHEMIDEPYRRIWAPGAPYTLVPLKAYLATAGDLA